MSKANKTPESLIVIDAYNIELSKQVLDEQSGERTIRYEGSLGVDQAVDDEADWEYLADFTFTIKKVPTEKYDRLRDALGEALAIALSISQDHPRE